MVGLTRRCAPIVLCALLLLPGCAQYYGKYARRGTDVVVKANDAKTIIEYQIFVPTADEHPAAIGFNSDQPILKTSETSFMFAIGRFVIRSRCGSTYKDTQVNFRHTGSSPQTVTLNCDRG